MTHPANVEATTFGNTEAEGYVDVLRLEPEEIHRLREMEANLRGQGAEFRREPRAAWASKALAEFTGPTGVTTRAVVYPFDLSSKGIGLLHGAYMHTGTRVHLRLWIDEEESIVVDGTVRRCGFLNGRTHAVGVEFMTPLPPGVVMAAAPDKMTSNVSDSSGPVGPPTAARSGPDGTAKLADELAAALRLVQQLERALRESIGRCEGTRGGYR
ncbi:MAG: PilZ domain-containing protein [Phycisphaerales bacterium]